MMKRGTKAVYSMLGLMTLWSMSTAASNAQVTVESVKVTLSGTHTAVYCDQQHLASCPAGAIGVWNLTNNGITLQPGQTLILTQTGATPANNFGNFDTSERVSLGPNLFSCTAADPCTVTIEINGVQVYSNAGPNPLNFGNVDDGSLTTNEAAQWVLAATKPNYTLQLGYADNEHTTTCPASGCLPNPFTATYFLGAGVAGEPGTNCGNNCYDAGALRITALQAPVTAVGRMTGGGSVFKNSLRITHGFEIHCDITDTPNTLEVNWADANNFHMDTLTSAVCSDDPAIDQKPPKSAGFDTFVGTGTGKLNGVAGATISFTFVDAGEPGTSDTAAYVIKDQNGNTVLTVAATALTKGNQQTHQ